MIFSLLCWFTVGIMTLFSLYSISKRGLPNGLWYPAAIALFTVPVWWSRTIKQLTIDARTIVGSILLGWLLFQPARRLSRSAGLNFVDGMLILFVVCKMASFLYWFELRPLTPIALTMLHVLPFLVGRYLLLQREDISSCSVVMAKVMCFTSLYAILEALIHENYIASNTNGLSRLMMEADYVRWGLKRAHATLTHPIFLGVLLAMFLPFVMEAVFREGKRSSWLYFACILILAGIFVTVSRAAQLVTFAAIGGAMFFSMPKLRLPLLFVLVVGLGVGMFAREELLNFLASYAGEAPSNENFVLINGEPFPYTGTTHRVLLYKAYVEAIEANGLFGWPGEIFFRNMPLDPSMDYRFSSIDDHYLKTFLEYGYLGLMSFILMAIAGGYAFLRVALDQTRPECRLAAMLFGTFLATTVVVRGVSMERDFSWGWYCLAGVASRMWSMRKDPIQAAWPIWPQQVWPTASWGPVTQPQPISGYPTHTMSNS